MIEERMKQRPLDEVFTDMSVGRINRNDKMIAGWMPTNPCLQCPCLICHIKKKNGEYCSIPLDYLNLKSAQRELLEYQIAECECGIGKGLVELAETIYRARLVRLKAMLKQLEATQ